MHAVLDRRVELEADVGRELEVLQPSPKLVADEALGGNEAGERFLLLLRVAEHADAHTCRPEVRRHADLSDAHEPDPRVLELAPNDGHDLLTHLLSDLVRAVAGHDDLRSQQRAFTLLTRFLLARVGMSPSCRRARTSRNPRQRCHIPAPPASLERLP